MHSAHSVYLPRSPLLMVFAALLCLGGSTGNISAQSPEIGHYDVRRISLQDGLSSQLVSALCTDKRGLLWIGTNNGLYRFDGFRVTRLDHPANPALVLPVSILNSLKEDTLNNLMFASTLRGSRAIDLFSGQNIPDTDLGLPEGFLDSCTYVEKSPFGFYWLLNRQTIYKLVSTSYRHYTCQPYNQLKVIPLSKLVADPADPERIWILPNRSEAYFINGQDVQHFAIPQNPAHKSPTPGFNQLLYTSNGIFGLDLARNVYRFDPEHQQFELFNHQYNLYNLFPSMEAVDESLKQKSDLRCNLDIWHGQKLFGTNLGLFIVRNKTSKFEVIEPLRGIEVRGIQTDSSGHWWAGTSESIFEGHKQGPGLEQFALDKAWDFLPIADHIFMVAKELATGIGFWDARKHQVVSETTLPQSISGSEKINAALSLCRDKEGSIWVGSNHQLWWAPSAAPSRFRPFQDFRTGNILHQENVRALLPDPVSGVWVGSESGLSRIVYNAQQQRYETAPGFSRLAGIYISDLFLDKHHRLWIATKGKGLACLNLNDLNAPIEWFNSSNGLCNDFACRIESSHNDEILWISTHNGISRFNVNKGSFQNFYEDSGFPSNEFNSAASAHFDDGTILFGGVSGLIKFHPDSIPVSTFQHKVILTAIKIYDQRIDSFQTINYTTPDGIRLSAYPEYLEFQLGSTEYTTPAMMRFRYRMRGLSELWTYTSGEHEVKFIRLAPGNYVFEVQAVPMDGHFSSVLLLPVFVETPFYETWWFVALLLLLVAGILFLAYRYRLRQIFQEQQIRRQIADDLHDDIGNKLNIISILAQKIANNHSENSPKTIDLTKLIEVSRNALRSLHTMIWSVDSDKDQLLSLINRMQDFADDYLRPLSIRFQFEIPQQVPDREIHLKARHHIMLIYQELLTNIVKYTQPTLINIQINLNQNTMQIQILNNHHTSNNPAYSTVSTERGLGSVERRVNQFNGQFSWVEPSEEQQVFTLIVPRIYKPR